MRGGFEERQRRHAVQRRAHQLRGEVRRVAAAGKAGDLDVGAGLAAGGFRPHAGRDLQQIRGALGIGAANFFLVGRDDVVAGLELLDAARRCDAGDDDGFEAALVGRAWRLGILLLRAKRGNRQRRRSRSARNFFGNMRPPIHGEHTTVAWKCPPLKAKKLWQRRASSRQKVPYTPGAQARCNAEALTPRTAAVAQHDAPGSIQVRTADWRRRGTWRAHEGRAIPA